MTDPRYRPGWHDVEVLFEGCRRNQAVDEAPQSSEVVVVVDLAAVGLGDEHADHVPRDVLRRDVGAAVGHGIDPCVDYETATLVLWVC